MQDTAVTTRSLGNSTIPVATFRVLSRLADGTRVTITSVRLEGEEAIGFAEDGDWVVVRGRRRRGVLQVTRGRNVTTGATFRGSVRLKAWIFVVVALVIFAVVGGLAVRAQHDFEQQRRQHEEDFEQQRRRQQEDFEQQQQQEVEKFHRQAVENCMRVGYTRTECEASIP